MKNFHDLDHARGYCLKKHVATIKALAVNLKRIASILSSNLANICNYIGLIFLQREICVNR